MYGDALLYIMKMATYLFQERVTASVSLATVEKKMNYSLLTCLFHNGNQHGEGGLEGRRD